MSFDPYETIWVRWQGQDILVEYILEGPRRVFVNSATRLVDHSSGQRLPQEVVLDEDDLSDVGLLVWEEIQQNEEDYDLMRGDAERDERGYD